MPHALLTTVLLLPSVLLGQRPDDGRSEQVRAVAINTEVLRIAAATPLWPGYHADSIPLAIFTGSRTYLFRHPSPPIEFTTITGVTSMPGRHPAVTANSSALIGGSSTATLLADGPRARHPVLELAAVAVHEAFHVYQRAGHKGWQGNEGDLFTYPAERADLLRLRREESELLRRALLRPSERACSAREAMTRRAERFKAMDAAHTAYERDSEMNEGLATYVQLRAIGKTSVEIPPQEYLATGIRDRFYAVGPALGFLLDATRPGWQTELERNDSLRLDRMLTEAVANAPGGCRLPADVAAQIARRATADANGVARERVAARRRFAQRTGWRLVIETAPGTPLWPQGFDPLNVTQVAGATLHHRLLTLGNDSLVIQMVDGEGADYEALTEPAGAHPLFNGLRRVEIVMPAKPTITTDRGVVTVSAPGLQGRLSGVMVEQGKDRLLVRARQ